MSNQALQRRAEALQYIDRSISPELKAQHAADRILVMKDQFGLALTWPQFLAYLELLREKKCSVYDRDFHALPTRTKTPDGKWVESVEFVASIHYFRKMGSADPRYRGTIGPEYGRMIKRPDGTEEVVWSEEWIWPGRPEVARCGIIVDGLDRVQWAYIRVSEFSKDTSTWKSMPTHMTGKVVEAHAWRKALPNALSGAYVEDEVEFERNQVSYSVSSDEKGPEEQPALAGRLASLPAPSDPVQVSEEPAEEAPPKSPEEAQREVLYSVIKDGMRKHTAFSTGKIIWKDVRAVVAMMSEPGPLSDGKPDMQRWSLEQVEELADLYEGFDSEPYKRPEGWEELTPDEASEESNSQENLNSSESITDVQTEVENPL